MKSPNWLEEELILAVNFYLEHGRKWVNSCSSKSPDIIFFSNLLKNLTMFTKEQRSISNFRSPSSVHMKLMNFKGIDQDNSAEGLRNCSFLDRQVWDTYSQNTKLLHDKVASILSEFSPPVDDRAALSSKTQKDNYLEDLSEAREILKRLSKKFRLVREKAVSITPIDESQEIINFMYEYISQLEAWHKTIDNLIGSASEKANIAPNKNSLLNFTAPQNTESKTDKEIIKFLPKYSSVSLNADMLKIIFLKIKELDARDVCIKTSALVDEMTDQILLGSTYQHPSYPLRAVINLLKDIGVIIPYQNAKIGKYIIEDYEIMQRLIDNPFQIQELIQNKE
jgi:hypothetical protein